MDLENERLWKFLGGIQLEQFHDELNQKLHVTRLEHLEHVVESDLLQIHMTMPEIRRLFDNLKKIKRKNFIAKLRRSLGLGSSTEITHKPLPRVASVDQPHSKGSDQNLRCLIHESNIVLKDVIGKGAFGYVQSADWIMDNGEKAPVAVKFLQRKGNNSILAAVETELIKEANAMSNLNHPNLIRLYGVVLSAKMMLVTELAPLGALLKRLRQEPKKFLISTLCSFVIQIAAGMKYLESHRFVHRDLAARNILLMSYEKIKIGDFGLARPLPDDTEYYVMQPDGLIPFAWCAPECLKFRKFSHASDMWAFGVTLVELFTYGAEPWAGCNGAQILERIDKPNFERPARPDHCPANIFAIIQDLCWRDNPDERGHFATLEKRILTALPYELKASTDWQPISRDQLYFEKGDIITVFDTKGSMKRCQNRRSLQIGYLPFAFIDISSGTIGDPDLGKTNSLPARQTAWYMEGRSESPGCDTNRPGSFTPAIHFQAPHSVDCSCCQNKSKTLPIRDNKMQGNNFYSGFNSPSDPRKNKNRLSLCESIRSRGDSCNSRLSWDSGYNCRSSSYYSSDSSQHYSDGSTHYRPQSPLSPVSTPINIPGRNENRNQSENVYYNHSSPLPFSEPSSSPLSSALEENFETDSNIYDEPIRIPCYNQSKSADNDLSISDEKDPTKRRSLPDIVNPRRKLDVYQRQRSLQGSRRKSAKAFANSAYLMPDTPSPPNQCFQRSASERYVVHKHFDDGELVMYDRVPSRRDLKQDIHHGSCSPTTTSIHEEVGVENYDVVPSHMNTNEIEFEPTENYDVVPSHNATETPFEPTENYDVVPCKDNNDNISTDVDATEFESKCKIDNEQSNRPDFCHEKKGVEEETSMTPDIVPRQDKNENKVEQSDEISSNYHRKKEKEKNLNQRQNSVSSCSGRLENVVRTGQRETGRGLSLTFGVGDDERENYENSFVLMHHSEKLGSCNSIGERPKVEKPPRPRSEICLKVKDMPNLNAKTERETMAELQNTSLAPAGVSLASLLTLSSSTSISSMPEICSIKQPQLSIENSYETSKFEIPISPPNPTEHNDNANNNESLLIESDIITSDVSEISQSEMIPIQGDGRTCISVSSPELHSVKQTGKYMPNDNELPELPPKAVGQSQIPLQNNEGTLFFSSMPSITSQPQENAYVNVPLLTSLKALIPPHRSLFGSDQWNCPSIFPNLMANFNSNSTSKVSRSYSPTSFNGKNEQQRREAKPSKDMSSSLSIDENSPPILSDYIGEDHNFRTRSFTQIGDEENETNISKQNKDLNRRPSLPPRLKKIKKLSLNDSRRPESVVKQCIILDGSPHKNIEKCDKVIDKRP